MMPCRCHSPLRHYIIDADAAAISDALLLMIATLFSLLLRHYYAMPLHWHYYWYWLLPGITPAIIIITPFSWYYAIIDISLLILPHAAISPFSFTMILLRHATLLLPLPLLFDIIIITPILLIDADSALSAIFISRHWYIAIIPLLLIAIAAFHYTLLRSHYCHAAADATLLRHYFFHFILAIAIIDYDIIYWFSCCHWLPWYASCHAIAAIVSLLRCCHYYAIIFHWHYAIAIFARFRCHCHYAIIAIDIITPHCHIAITRLMPCRHAIAIFCH